MSECTAPSPGTRRAIALRTLLLDAVAAQAIAGLEDHGISSILLKGRVLADWLYPNGLRDYCDVDLLVDPAQRERAIEVLATIGYRHWLAGADASEYGAYETELIGPNNICIDLHHCLLGITIGPARCWEVLSAHTVDKVVGGRTVQVLDIEARALHLALHVVKKGLVDTKAVADLERGLARVPFAGWQRAAGLATLLGAEEAFSGGLRVSSAGAVLARTLEMAPPRDVSLVLRTRSAPHEALLIESLVQMRSVRARGRLVGLRLWPTEAYMRAHTPELPSGAAALLGARLHRLAGLPKRFAVASHSWSQARRLVAATSTSTGTTVAARPTPREGLRGLVLVAGPDGAGKTTVVDQLVERLEASGTSVWRAHCRPGLIFGGSTDAGPVTEPHRQVARSTAASVAKLGIVFADHLVGGLSRWRAQRRQGVVLLERGWFDMIVDPRRYRVPTRLSPLVLALGCLLPRADVALLLTGDPAALHARKPEIGVTEVDRQQRRWRAVAPRAARRVVEIDTVGADPASAADSGIRALAYPSRWRRVPLTPARVALTVSGDARPALAVYQPQSVSARGAALVWRTAGLRGRRTDEPVPAVDELWRSIGVRPDGVAAMRSWAPGRRVLSVCTDGRLEMIAKIGDLGDEELRNEAEILAIPLRSDLPFGRPQTIWSGEWRDRFVVVSSAVRRSSSVPWTLEEVIPLVEAMATAGPDGQPLIHGDLAPWNLIRTAAGPVLLDWEFARWADEPLYDLAHYVVQVGALLGQYRPHRAVSLLCDEGSPGAGLLERRGLDVTSAPEHVHRFLSQFRPTEQQAIRYRAEMRLLVTVASTTGGGSRTAETQGRPMTGGTARRSV